MTHKTRVLITPAALAEAGGDLANYPTDALKVHIPEGHEIVGVFPEKKDDDGLWVRVLSRPAQ